MKFISTFLLALLLAVMPVSAADGVVTYDIGGNETGRVSKPVTVTKSAHILEGSGLNANENIVVYFSPFQFSSKGDTARQLQRFSRGNAEIVQSKGSPLQQSLVPGQEVGITFTYQMRQLGTYSESGGEGYINDSPYREMEIISVEKIQLKGRALRLGQHTEMKPNTLLGTVLSVSSRSMTVYAEGGLVYYGDDEYVAKGQHSFTVNSNTRIFDKDGKRIQANGIRPFQRVEVIAGDYMWLETDPPQFGGGTARTIRILEHGDKWLDFTAHRDIDVVVERQISATELLVQPLWANQRYETPKAVVRIWGGGPAYAPEAEEPAPDVVIPPLGGPYKPGQILRISYLAVNRKSNPAVYSYATVNWIDPTRRWTAQEFSGVFGKPGDVTLAVPKTVEPNAAHINAIWTNKTASQLMYGEPYRLERKTDGKWAMYNEPDRKENYGFNMPAYTVEPRSEAKMDYWVRAFSDKLPGGTYRIVTDFSPYTASGDAVPGGYIIYSNEFTVK